MSPSLANGLAQQLSALADPMRLRILSLMSSLEPRPVTVTELTDLLGCAQGTTSHHLKLLHESGMVQVERSGNWRLYRANADAVAELVGRLTVVQ